MRGTDVSVRQVKPSVHTSPCGANPAELSVTMRGTEVNIGHFKPPAHVAWRS